MSSFARLSLSLVGVVGILAVALAGATIWLLITQPVTVADAVAQGEVSPLARALAGALYDALRGLLKYL
jgi:multidrug resistance efflux pump